jgi:two-component system, response regulator
MNNAVEILLVEDNPADIELTLRELRHHHLANRVEVVEDGEKALQFLFRQGAYADRPLKNPNLILLDLKLPKVDGIEVLREVRSDDRTTMIPVVVLTSSKEQQDVVNSYQLHVNSYIQKPVDFRQFQKTIDELGYYWMVVNVPPPGEGAVE